MLPITFGWLVAAKLSVLAVMLHLTYPDIARLITLAEQDYCLPHLPSDLNSSGWAMILLFLQIQIQYVAFVVFLFCFVILFVFSFRICFLLWFLVLFSFTIFLWLGGATEALLKHSEVPSSSQFFFPDTPFLPLWRGSFLAQKVLVLLSSLSISAQMFYLCWCSAYCLLFTLSRVFGLHRSPF